jgi:chaperonin GroES
MNVIPLHDRILVRLSETAGDRARTNGFVDASEARPVRGVVIAAGAGTIDDQGQTVPLTVQAGDIILFGRHLAQEVTFGGTGYWIMKADAVISVELKAPPTTLRDGTRSVRPTRSS